jgi:hypothetical protein
MSQPPTEGAGVSVSAFLAGAGTLTLDQRKTIVDQALVLFEQNYVHLPLKIAMHAVNPVQRLRVLRARLDRETPATIGAEWVFHREVSSIFLSVRDLHTNYLLPAPFAGKIAYLPFQIEKGRVGGVDRYLVTRTVAGFTGPSFGQGAEVTHWNGTPIARAVEINGALFAGSNRAANLARGLESLTLRPLVLQLPPDEDWVVVTYKGVDNSQHEIRVEWTVATNLPPMTDLDAVTGTATSLGLDLDSDERARAKKLLFVPDVVELEGGVSSANLPAPAAVGAADVPTTMPGVFRARSVTTASGTFGHVRIFTFSVEDPVAFRDEYVRLVRLLPQNGLIVDVRDNGGGHIYASEFTLQTMTPRHIKPTPVQFISTPINLRLCRRHRTNPTGQIDLGPWFDSLDQATETGSLFSAAKPITPEDGANEIGQTYHGPAVLVTDARCYSATDIFASGWADHEVGPILGVDDNTGAGGANVWTHGLLSALMRVPDVDPASPYKPLPGGANMRVSIRRTLRVGELSGTPVEDLGVAPSHRHRLTRNDLLNSNQDLLNAAGQILAAMPQRKLSLTTSVTGSTISVQISSTGLDRVDVFVDGRPSATKDVAGPTTSVSVPGASGDRVRLEGFKAGVLVAARQVTA